VEVMPREIFFLAGLAVLALSVGIAIGAKISHLRAENKFVRILQTKEAEWLELARVENKSSLARSRAVIGGQFSEQLAPFLPDFPYDATEVRFVGKPVDFIAFKGLAQGQVTKVAFIEVKSGVSRLSQNEISVRQAIESGQVEFVEYRVPHALTRSDNG